MLPRYMLVDNLDVSLEYRANPENQVLPGFTFLDQADCWNQPISIRISKGLPLVLFGTTKNSHAKYLEGEERLMEEDKDFDIFDLKMVYRSLQDRIYKVKPKKDLPFLALAVIPAHEPKNGLVRINEIPKQNPETLMVQFNYFESTSPKVDNPRYYLVQDNRSDKDYVHSIERMLNHTHNKRVTLLEACFEPPWYLIADPHNNRITFLKSDKDT